MLNAEVSGLTKIKLGSREERECRACDAIVEVYHSNILLKIR